MVHRHALEESYTLNMSGPEDSIHEEAEAERLKADQNRVEFLGTELATCFTFADLADTEYNTGDREACERSLADAEEGYSTILRFMCCTPGHC